jgi:high-affinity iron transporter
MWQGFTIALREGIESFLIVAVTLAWLKKTGRARLARAVVLGIVASLGVCAAAGWALSRAANQPLWEGILAAVSALLVGSFLVYMLRTARTLKANLERRLDHAARGRWLGGAGGVFLFTVLMITREGMEATLLLTTALFQVRSAAVVMGVVFGLVGAAAVALTWQKLGRRVNLGILLNISAVFLGVFLLQLCLYAVHELAEAGALPNAEAIHGATEILGPDGIVGQIVTYLLAALPTGWLLYAWLRPQTRPAARADAGPPPVGPVSSSESTRAA